jgi:hypothetical protein
MKGFNCCKYDQRSDFVSLNLNFFFFLAILCVWFLIFVIELNIYKLI